MVIKNDSIQEITADGWVRKRIRILGIKTPFYINGGYSETFINYQGKPLHSHWGYVYKKERYDINDYFRDGLLVLNVEKNSKINKKEKKYETTNTIKKYYFDGKLIHTSQNKNLNNYK